MSENKNVQDTHIHGEHPGVMYSHRKRLIRKMRVVV